MFPVIVAVFAGFAALWAIAVWAAGGLNTSLMGITIRSQDPLRPLILSAAAAAIYLTTGGRAAAQRMVAPLAVLLAIMPAAAGIARNSWTAGGADSYAYVSQADLWLRRDLIVPVPLASDAPWPQAVSTFAPHGFRPAPSGAAIVPVTAPGLPMMMAAAKAVAGHCAMFLVTPLSGAWLVLVTFAIGRTIGGDWLGIASAWLIATSPAVLAMVVSPMSDVPAAALWATAIYLALKTTQSTAWLCGLIISAAILIRPNLAPLAAVIAGWRWLSGQPMQAMRIAAGAVPGCLFIAAINNHLYGSPTSSGYGSLDALFSLSHVAVNLRRYAGWLMDSQTPLALAAIPILFVPAKVVWVREGSQKAAGLLGATAVVVWALYLAYVPFDAWWFLRFLLPAWPAVAIGTAALALLPARFGPRVGAAAAVLAVAGLGVYGLRFAAANGAFPTGEGEHRYASAAKLVEAATPQSAVVFAGQHGGPIRYYAGRTVVRFDLMPAEWLDRSVEWLLRRGRQPYILLDYWEVPIFRERFVATQLGARDLVPIAEYRAPGVPGPVYLFDVSAPAGTGAAMAAAPEAARQRCVPPAPLLHLP